MKDKTRVYSKRRVTLKTFLRVIAEKDWSRDSTQYERIEEEWPEYTIQSDA